MCQNYSKEDDKRCRHNQCNCTKHSYNILEYSFNLSQILTFAILN